ncbi:hypothetical protein HOB94_00205 [bacterium]|nr:hypothetical protein [bacterium]MBT4632445.1 hypothetical protein [bacterium]MBT5492347.1 hypothetical protein [bacterium]MBT6779552.1 hypothetical protein [bacterium]
MLKYHNLFKVTCSSLTECDISQNFGVHIKLIFSSAFFNDNSSSCLYFSSNSFFLNSSCCFSFSTLSLSSSKLSLFSVYLS